MKKKLPKFKSEEEEARFWDTHSPLDYQDEFTDVEEPFEISPSLLKKVAKRREERKKLLTLRIGQHQIDLARVVARCRGIGYQTQMRMWVIEGMHKDIAAHPEIRKLLVAK